MIDVMKNIILFKIKFCRISILALLASLLFVSGCGKTFSAPAFTGALLDSVCKADYTDYSEFTGVTTADLSAQREDLIDEKVDTLIAMYGNLRPSSACREDIRNFINMLYEQAVYTVSDPRATAQTGEGSGAEDEAGAIVSVSPILIFSDCSSDIQKFTDSFNKKNNAHKYKDKTSTQYADTYLQGVMSILRDHLGDIRTGDAVEKNLVYKENDKGLYTADPDQIKAVFDLILPLK